MQKTKKIIRTERIHLPPFVDFTEHCKVWAEVYNYCHDLRLQHYLSHQPFLTDKELRAHIKQLPDYHRWKTTIGSNIINQSLKVLYRVWRSYFGLKKSYDPNDPNTIWPSLPGYTGCDWNGQLLGTILLDQRALKSVSSQRVKIKPGQLMLPKTFDNLVVSLFKAKDKKILSGSIKPIATKRFVLLVQYEADAAIPKQKTAKRIAAIDPGLVNAITMVDNIGSQPVYARGGEFNSINQWFNKQQAKLQKYGRGDTNAIRKIAGIRTRRMHDTLHKLAKAIIAWCKNREIDTIIIGKNEGWKQNVVMWKKMKQKFMYFPFIPLFEKIEDKAEMAGIEVEYTEEDYTSKCSFLDNEPMRKRKKHLYSRRLKRGLYRSLNGTLRNACTHSSSIIHGDVNAAYNIGRKVYPRIFHPNKITVHLYPRKLSY